MEKANELLIIFTIANVLTALIVFLTIWTCK